MPRREGDAVARARKGDQLQRRALTAPCALIVTINIDGAPAVYRRGSRLLSGYFPAFQCFREYASLWIEMGMKHDDRRGACSGCLNDG